MITLYHGTSAAVLPSIQKVGLTSPKYNMLYATLTTNIKQSKLYAGDTPRGVLLTFKIPKELASTFLKIVPNRFETSKKNVLYGLKRPIPPKYLRKITKMRKRT